MWRTFFNCFFCFVGEDFPVSFEPLSADLNARQSIVNGDLLKVENISSKEGKENNEGCPVKLFLFVNEDDVQRKRNGWHMIDKCTNKFYTFKYMCLNN